MSTQDYAVGYAKPPTHTQFKPGQSGNPSGRPKKTIRLNDVVIAEVNATIIVKDNGCPKEVTRLEAMIRTAMAMAMKGDIKAMTFLTKLLGPAENEANNGWKEHTQQRTSEAIATASAAIKKLHKEDPLPELNDFQKAEFEEQKEYWEAWRKADEKAEDFPTFEEWKKLKDGGAVDKGGNASSQPDG